LALAKAELVGFGSNLTFSSAWLIIEMARQSGFLFNHLQGVSQMDNTTVVQEVIIEAFVPCCKALVSGSKAKGKALDQAAKLFMAITDYTEQLDAIRMLAKAYQEGQELEGLTVSKYKSALGYIRTQMANRNPDFKLQSQTPNAVAKRALVESKLPLVTDATDDETKDKPKALKAKVVSGQKNFLHELADSLKAFTDGGCSKNPEGFRQLVSAFMISAVQNEIGIVKTN
jgi:hypothetical protein